MSPRTLAPNPPTIDCPPPLKLVTSPSIRIGVVLSAGGLRGAAHLGVLRKLTASAVPLDVIVGVSAGAVIAAYYAAVGLTVEEMIADARVFRGRHLVAHSLNLRSHRWLAALLEPLAGVIPSRLRQLESGRFERLHHGVHAIGVVCHDLTHGRPRYLSTADHGAVPLYDAVATSASIPSMFPSRPIEYGGRVCEFTDGGVSDSLPVGFARTAGLDATHLVVSDCRSRGAPMLERPDAVYIRPSLGTTRVLRAPRASLLAAVAAGERAVTDAMVTRIRGWLY